MYYFGSDLLLNYLSPPTKHLNFITPERSVLLASGTLSSKQKISYAENRDYYNDIMLLL
jgi:hypothetical protein